MDLKFLIAIFFALNVLVSGFMDTDLILAFFKAKNLKHNVVLTCYNKKAQLQISRKLAVEQDILVSIKSIKYLNILNTLVSNYKRLGVVLDGDCLDAKGLLLRCKKYKVFDSKHFWLVLRNSSDYNHLFKFANLNVNSDIKVAYYSNGSLGKYVIDDVYNPAYEKGGNLKTSEVGFYDTKRGYHIDEAENKYFARKNFTGVRFKSVIVLSDPFNGSLEDYLLSDRDMKINTFNRFHSRIMHYCKDFYNFSMDIELDKSWGYLQSDGTMDGLVGALEKRMVDFGLSPLLINKDRAKFISYGRKTWNLRAAFIFRNPKSRKSYQIFIKPFSLQVWLFVVMSSILSVFAQKLGYGLDKRIEKKYCKQRDVDDSWSFSTVCTFGAFCQQGIISFPNCLSGRTAALVTLLLGMLIYQFYSASLVSFLLNVPTTVITTVQGILDNGFQIGCDNTLFDKDFLKYATDNVTREVYRRLLIVSNNRSGFINPDLGLELIKKGRFAYHVQLVPGYQYIEKYFDETTICELKEVLMYPVKAMHANYQKWSPFKDAIDVCLQKFGENGVIARELILWHPRKPACMRSSDTININTGLRDFYPALVVLLVGMVMSMEILVIEILWHHRKNRKTLDIKETPFPYLN